MAWPSRQSTKGQWNAAGCLLQGRRPHNYSDIPVHGQLMRAHGTGVPKIELPDQERAPVGDGTGTGVVTRACGITPGVGVGVAAAVVPACGEAREASRQAIPFKAGRGGTGRQSARTVNMQGTASELNALPMGAGVVVTGMLARAVSAGTVAAGTVSAGTVAAGTVSAGTVAAGTVSAGTVAAGTVSAGTVAAGTVSAGTVAAGTVSAGTVAAGTVSAGTVAAGTVSVGAVVAACMHARQAGHGSGGNAEHLQHWCELDATPRHAWCKSFSMGRKH